MSWLCEEKNAAAVFNRALANQDMPALHIISGSSHHSNGNRDNIVCMQPLGANISNAQSIPYLAFTLTFTNLTYYQFTYGSATSYLDQLLAMLVPNSNVVGYLRCYASPPGPPTDVSFSIFFFDGDYMAEKALYANLPNLVRPQSSPPSPGKFFNSGEFQPKDHAMNLSGPK